MRSIFPTLASKSSLCADMGVPGIGGIIPGGGMGPPGMGPPCIGAPKGGRLKSDGLGKCIPPGFTGLLNASDIDAVVLRVLLGMSASELLDTRRDAFFFNAAIIFPLLCIRNCCLATNDFTPSGTCDCIRSDNRQVSTGVG